MLEQLANSITFFVFYSALKVGVTGLTVTVDVWEVTKAGASTEIVTAGVVDEIGDGLYRYVLASGSVDVEGEYVAVFKTADVTVDQQHIPAIWAIQRAGVENLDAVVSDTATAAALATVDGIVDNILLNTVEIGAAGAGLTALGDVRLANLDAAVSSRAATGGDGDTLETLSDQLDVAQADLDSPSQYKADVSALATASALTTVGNNVVLVLANTGTDGVVVAATSKTGYKLASDGLDSVSITAPTGVASNFREMVVQLFHRFFGRATMTSTELKTYAADGTTVVTTQTLSDDNITQIQGKAT